MKDLADITVILDRSGSMAAIQKDVEGGFDTFVKEQRETPGEAVLSLYQFDTEYECVYKAVPLNKVKKLSLIPRGSTALLDAIGRSITETGERLAALPDSGRPDKVIFVIMTDGAENSSREYKRELIFEMITHQQEAYNWKFVFLAANQDAIQTGQSIGIAKGSSISYAADSVGTQSVYAATSGSVASYRTGKSADITYDQAARDASMGKKRSGSKVVTP